MHMGSGPKWVYYLIVHVVGGFNLYLHLHPDGRVSITTLRSNATEFESFIVANAAYARISEHIVSVDILKHEDTD